VDDAVADDAEDESPFDDVIGHPDLGGRCQHRPVRRRDEERTLVDQEPAPARRPHLATDLVGGFQYANGNPGLRQPMRRRQSRWTTAHDDDLVRRAHLLNASMICR